MAQREDITTIQVSRELKDFLVAQAIRKDETYDQILKRLLKKIWGVNIEGGNSKSEAG